MRCELELERETSKPAGICRISNPGSRADFHTKELTLRGPSSRGNRFPLEKAFRNYATETWTAASLSAVEMHAFRQDALAFRKESSLPHGLASGSRKRLRHSKRYGNHSILIHDGFEIRMMPKQNMSVFTAGNVPCRE